MKFSYRLFGQSLFRGGVTAAAEELLAWPKASRYVCVANVHTVMQALWDPQLRLAMRGADMAVPDGRPLSLLARLKGEPGVFQVRGVDLMKEMTRQGLKSGAVHYFFGGRPGIAELAAKRLKALTPGMKVAGWESPPFRPLTEIEQKALIARLKRKRVTVLWVGLGAPKQEKWMAFMKGKIPCTMLGVGAAFDFHAGSQSEAPRWVQSLALEWFYRLVMEPRRLWKRYALTNTAFLLLAPFELLGFWPENKERAA